MRNKRGQVAIFIIIAILIVGAVAGFFILRGRLGVQKIPSSIEPVYKTFLSCLEDKTLVGIDVIESQAGYIELPKFEPGNSYMPFSSQLDFLGNPIPYWYYVSGNNLQEEQVPTKVEMQNELEKFIENNARKCDFESYYENGFEILQGQPAARAIIRDNQVDIKVYMDLNVVKGEDTTLVKTHSISVQSKLGTLYNSARKIYNKEQKDLFLENYAIDTLRLYAPVDGVEISCAPKVWIADDIFNNLKDAIETNTLALKTGSASTEADKYFTVDGVDGEVRFINSKDWANSFEVSPTDENILMSNPVGNQPGLGILGFCYVPYHFVYSVKYPVLIQITNGEETFQFPVAVIIQGNKPRKALDAEAKEITPELCRYKNTPVTVRTYDTNLNSVDAHVSYECFGETCSIGDTSNGIINSQFPQCANGYVIAKADGFEEARTLYSTTQTGSVDVIMDKLYDLNVRIKLDGNDYNGNAMVYFVSDADSKAVYYPEQKSVELTEGDYEVQVYIYRDSSIQLPETTQQECVEIPSKNVLGLLGVKEKKCFDVTIPSQLISSVPAGGGKQKYFFFEGELQASNTIELNAKGFAVPKTLEEVQMAYSIFEANGLEINLR